MELTRRDAAAALAAIGATGGVALGVRRAGDGAERPDGAGSPDGGVEDGEGVPDDGGVREAMTAVARVLYPEEVTGVGAFVEAFLDGRLDGSAHGEGIRAAVGEVRSASRSWYDAPVAELSAADRDSLLRELGADTAEEDPRGSAAERVRYYVVNELLLALYASPTGGDLVGIENPQGYAGGAESYTRGPR